MDADALADARRAEWERLDALSRARLDGAGVDELILRYRAASADLADLKTSVGSSPQSAHVSTILARARLRLTGAGDNVLAQTGRFFALQLPAALYRVRWTTLVVALVTLAIIAGMAAWISSDPALVATLGPADLLAQYAEEDFTGYYTENPAAVFAGMVWTNNAWITAQCVVFGVTGIWPVYIIVQNAVGLGISAAVMFSHGRGDVMVLYLLPHGLLELTCVFVAAAAGLHVFWAWVAPGARTRSASLAAEGRSLATIALGLVFALALAGLIEGFVTGWSLPWPIKIGIGVAALAIFLVYMIVIGGRAARRGETGDLVEFDAGTPTLAAS
ncbi:putative membrane protein SpoIIM required for sporulation [Microbacterium resistens]|uniref:Membrane protein SpoIIM required for sporulation n=1 Tax=Microbacterium resistens TaxID=156977 RepID=A0ABU1S9S0_9MICO|nr:stage II sporulation protein M [Microbacterium resistens]MDR6866349.1 putative membrane protein SpoIIM required for sporulation [Microbacterium resistens]